MECNQCAMRLYDLDKVKDNFNITVVPAVFISECCI